MLIADADQHRRVRRERLREWVAADGRHRASTRLRFTRTVSASQTIEARTFGPYLFGGRVSEPGYSGAGYSEPGVGRIRSTRSEDEAESDAGSGAAGNSAACAEAMTRPR